MLRNVTHLFRQVTLSTLEEFPTRHRGEAARVGRRIMRRENTRCDEHGTKYHVATPLGAQSTVPLARRLTTQHYT